MLSSFTGFRLKRIKRHGPLENQGVARVSSSLRLGASRSTCSSHGTSIRGAAAVAAASGRCLGVRGGANRPLHATVPAAETPTSDTAAEVCTTLAPSSESRCTRHLARCALLRVVCSTRERKSKQEGPVCTLMYQHHERHNARWVTPVVQEQCGVS